MDIRLHYLEKGKGTPLLLLHGNGESAEYFEHQISFFSENIMFMPWTPGGMGSRPEVKRLSRWNNLPWIWKPLWMKRTGAG